MVGYCSCLDDSKSGHHYLVINRGYSAIPSCKWKDNEAGLKIQVCLALSSFTYRVNDVTSDQVNKDNITETKLTKVDFESKGVNSVISRSKDKSWSFASYVLSAMYLLITVQIANY